MEGSSRMASMSATPMPLSAPSVVSRAMTQSPSISNDIGSPRKSWELDSSFSATMSTWAWRQTGAEPEAAPLPGCLMRTFPTSSIS